MKPLVLWCCALLMNDWYSGPLSERQIVLPARGWSAWMFRPVGPDGPKIAALSERLRQAPIFVLALGNPYAGYGLEAGRDGRVLLVQFNWLVAEAIEAAGVDWLDSEPGLIEPRHRSLAWALSALRSLGIEPDVDWQPGFPEHSKTWEGQLAHDARDADPYDPSLVRYVLEELGAEIPEDLAMVPAWVPPPPPPPPKPKSRAEIRAEIERLGLPVPASLQGDED